MISVSAQALTRASTRQIRKAVTTQEEQEAIPRSDSHAFVYLIENNSSLDTGLVSDGVQRLTKILKLVRVRHNASNIDFSCLQVVHGTW